MSTSSRRANKSKRLRTEEDESDFEEVSEEITLTETVDPLFGIGVDLDEQLSS